RLPIPPPGRLGTAEISPTPCDVNRRGSLDEPGFKIADVKRDDPGFASRDWRAISGTAQRCGTQGENMRSRRTAVLGGSGFIGRYVVKRLAARGDVVPVGCRSAEEAKFLRPMGDVGQVEPLSVAIDDE